METKRRVVILGAGYAGMLATIRLAGKVKSGEVEITLVNASATFAERVRMHQIASNQPIRQYPIEGFLRGKAVNFVQGWVSVIQTDTQEVVIQTAEGERVLPYDNLIYALGSFVDRSRTPGAEEYTYSLNPDSVVKFREILPSMVQKHCKLIVVGSGLTGIEASTEFAEMYPDLQVSIVTRGVLGDDLSKKGQSYLRKRFAKLGIEMIEHVSIEQVEAGALLTDSSERIPFDLCLWVAGFGVPQIAKQAGIAVNEHGQVLVDDKLQSLSHPEIFGVGDSSILVPSANLPLRMACATAMPMSAQAIDNVVALHKGKSMTSFAFGFVLRCISLGRHDALVQLVKADDTPKERIITGRLGAFIKEGIVKFTIWSLWWERRFPGAYLWLKSIKAQSQQGIVEREKVASWSSLNNIAR